MNCNKFGCSKEATHVPKLVVPVIAIANQEETATGIIGLKLCEEHADEIGLDAFPNIKEVFHTISNLPGADWEKAHFIKVALTSNEYELYENPPKMTSDPVHIKGLANPTAPMPRALPPSAFN